MRLFRGSRMTQWFAAASASLAGLLLTFPVCLKAANTCTGVQGQNGVYAYCNNGSLGIVGSSAFVDASKFVFSGSDFCGVLKGILGAPTGFISGTVVDARGLNSNNTNMTCTGTPWSGITNPPPSTILLPAGTIVTSSTWTLPTGTHLVGVGDGIGSGTTIQSTPAFSENPGPLIAFCSSACMGVSVERLNLDGLGGNISAIINQFAGEARGHRTGITACSA